MARPEDVTDLRRYRRERERAQKAAAAKASREAPKPESLLGGRRYAGLILVLAIVVLAALALFGHGF